MKHPTPTAAPETLYAAALYLATRYAASGCPQICRMLAQHFECIADHPDPAVPDRLRDTCRRLQAEWERIGAGRELTLRGGGASAAPHGGTRALH